MLSKPLSSELANSTFTKNLNVASSVPVLNLIILAKISYNKINLNLLVLTLVEGNRVHFLPYRTQTCLPAVKKLN